MKKFIVGKKYYFDDVMDSYGTFLEDTGEFLIFEPIVRGLYRTIDGKAYFSSGMWSVEDFPEFNEE